MPVCFIISTLMNFSDGLLLCISSCKYKKQNDHNQVIIYLMEKLFTFLILYFFINFFILILKFSLTILSMKYFCIFSFRSNMFAWVFHITSFIKILDLNEFLEYLHFFSVNISDWIECFSKEKEKKEKRILMKVIQITVIHVGAFFLFLVFAF